MVRAGDNGPGGARASNPDIITSIRWTAPRPGRAGTRADHCTELHWHVGASATRQVHRTEKSSLQFAGRPGGGDKRQELSNVASSLFRSCLAANVQWTSQAHGTCRPDSRHLLLVEDCRLQRSPGFPTAAALRLRRRMAGQQLGNKNVDQYVPVHGSPMSERIRFQRQQRRLQLKSRTRTDSLPYGMTLTVTPPPALDSPHTRSLPLQLEWTRNVIDAGSAMIASSRSLYGGSRAPTVKWGAFTTGATAQ